MTSLLAKASTTATFNRKLEQVIQHVEVGIFNMRQLEEAFLLQHDQKILEDYSDVAKKVIATLTEASKDAGDATTVSAIRVIRTGVEHDTQEFQRFTKLYRQISLSADEGLQARLRVAGGAIEKIVQSPDLHALATEVQLIRGIEMRFMEGDEAQYVEKLDKQRQAFNGLLAASAAAPALKQQLSALMDSYQKGIHDWADFKAATVKEMTDVSRTSQQLLRRSSRSTPRWRRRTMKRKNRSTRRGR